MGRFSSSVVFALFVITLTSGVFAVEWKNLFLRFPDKLINGYYEIGLTKDKLLSQGPWTLMTKDEDLNVTYYSYPNDPRVAIGFDSYNNVAGIRVSYIKADIPKKAQNKGLSFPYTFDDKPMFSSGKFWDTEVYYNDVLFVHPAKLKEGGRWFTYGDTAENVYLKLYGNWTTMPRDECKAKSLGFTKQGCFPGMGQHYFLGNTPTSGINDHQGVFLLYDHGELVGLGLIPFGSFTNGADKSWFEDPPVTAVKMILPNRPPAFTEWVTDYGTTSLHIFFKKCPRTTLCPLPMFGKRC